MVLYFLESGLVRSGLVCLLCRRLGVFWYFVVVSDVISLLCFGSEKLSDEGNHYHSMSNFAGFIIFLDWIHICIVILCKCLRCMFAVCRNVICFGSWNKKLFLSCWKLSFIVTRTMHINKRKASLRIFDVRNRCHESIKWERKDKKIMLSVTVTIAHLCDVLIIALFFPFYNKWALCEIASQEKQKSPTGPLFLKLKTTC